MSDNKKKPAVEEAKPIEAAVKETAPEKPEPKKFTDTDLIPCRSVTAGGLYVTGPKTGRTYEFIGLGDTDNIEYKDLLALVRQRDPMLFKPRYVVEDVDFINQNPTIAQFYQGLYTTDDFNKLLAMEPEALKGTLEKLPEGVKDALKGYISGQIEAGTFDSVGRIKVIDEAFGTDMLMRLTK